jgi:hypothetical protein
MFSVTRTALSFELFMPCGRRVCLVVHWALCFLCFCDLSSPIFGAVRPCLLLLLFLWIREANC